MKVTISPSESEISFSTAFRRSSNSPRYLAPATIEPKSRPMIRLFLSDSGTSPSTMRVARPSTIAVLPTPGSPMSTGLFFVPPREDLDDTADLVVAPDDGVELAAPCELGEVTAVALQRLVLLLGALRGDAVAAADCLQRPQQVVTADPDAVRKGEQQVLDREVLVAHLLASVVGTVEGLGQLAAERGLGDAVGLGDPGERLGDLVADRQRGDPEAVEEGDRHPAVLRQCR